MRRSCPAGPPGEAGWLGQPAAADSLLTQAGGGKAYALLDCLHSRKQQQAGPYNQRRVMVLQTHVATSQMQRAVVASVRTPQTTIVQPGLMFCPSLTPSLAPPSSRQRLLNHPDGLLASMTAPDQPPASATAANSPPLRQCCSRLLSHLRVTVVDVGLQHLDPHGLLLRGLKMSQHPS